MDLIPYIYNHRTPPSTKAPCFLHLRPSIFLHLASFICSLLSQTNTIPHTTLSLAHPTNQLRTIAPRRASTRGSASTRASTRRTRGGVRKKNRTRKLPSRYGQHEITSSITIASEASNKSLSESEDVEPSIPESRQSPEFASHIRHQSAASSVHNTPQNLAASKTSVQPNESYNRSAFPASTRGAINIDTMRVLLRSHKQDIMNRVVHQLNSQIPTQYPATHSTPQALPPSHSGTQPPLLSATQLQIAELENQLAQL